MCVYGDTGGARAAGRGVRGTPHDLVLALLLLALSHHDAFDDGALLRGEMREVWHVGHGGRRRAASGARARRVLRCCARGATLHSEVYLIMPGGPMARRRALTSARLLIARQGAPRAHSAAAGSPRPNTDVYACAYQLCNDLTTHLYSPAAYIKLLTLGFKCFETLFSPSPERSQVLFF